RGRESEVSHEMAAGAHGDVRSRRVPCERGGGDGAGHRATTAPGTAIVQDQGIVTMALTESLVRLLIRDSWRASRSACQLGHIPLVTRWHGVARGRDLMRSERPAEA